MKILLVDDERVILEQISDFLEGCGYCVSTAAGGHEALETLSEDSTFSIALLDYKMPGMNGLQLAKEIKANYPHIILLMMTAYGTIETAVSAIKSGIHDYMIKPVGAAQLKEKIEALAGDLHRKPKNNSIEPGASEQNDDKRFDCLVGASEPMQNVFRQLEAAAQSDLNVLVFGETGTGKELAARAIHSQSKRKNSKMVAINCGAFSETLLESELFGHVKGAFTGAYSNRSGKIASADGGTLFLDEISASSLNFQSRLLRVLEERCFTPVGSDKTSQIDIRIIASMNIVPETAVEDGSLRKDLFYRLNVMRVNMPPLDTRLDDIPLLVDEIVKKSAYPNKPRIIPQEFLDGLMKRNWPGNVRELRNTIEAALVKGNGTLNIEHVVQAEHLMRRLDSVDAVDMGGMSKIIQESAFPERPGEIPTLKMFLSRHERRRIKETLYKTNGNVREAADVLDVTERNLRQKLKKLKVDPERFRDDN